MLVAKASLPEQQALVGTLADMPRRLAEHPLPSPCVILVGSVVNLVAQSPANANGLAGIIEAVDLT